MPEDAGSVSLRVSLNQSLVEDEFIELSVMVINDTACEFSSSASRIHWVLDVGGGGGGGLTS